MGKWLLSALLTGSVIACGPAAGIAAAAPANDAFAAATPLVEGTEISGTNVDATVEVGEPNPTSSSQANTCVALTTGPECGTSVWYTFQPAVSGQYTIDACDGGTDFDSVIGVYTGTTLGTMSEVGYSYQGPACPEVSGGRSQFTFSATGGTLYHVDVTGYEGEQGSFYLRVYPGPAQARPAPDTEVIRYSSLSDAINTNQSSPGVRSGPRHSASFALISRAPGASFECALDGGAFAPCATTVSYDDLAPGAPHVFSARAVAGGVADPTPVVERFTVDDTPPDTLLSGPSGPQASQTATWITSGTERYNRGLGRCGIDDTPTIVCNYAAATFESLCAGHHSFHSAAVDNATNVDPTPATASIDVTTGPPCAAPTLPKPPNAAPTSTSALVFMYYDDMGAGGRLHVEYGPTAAYGMQLNDVYAPPTAGENGTKTPMLDLTPDTLYHFRVTITTPYGSATTPDQTVTTTSLESPLPTIENGTPEVAGQHAATLPATIDPKEFDSIYFAYVQPGAPVTPTSPVVLASEVTIPAKQGPQPALMRLVDLEAATTYHYRFRVEQQGGGGEVLGPEGTFTTPPYPRAHFKLRRKSIRVGRLTRRSKQVRIAVSDLPAGTVVIVKLVAGRRHLKARKKAKAKNEVRFTIRFPRKFRRALHTRALRAVKLEFAASPPEDSTSRVTLRKKLKSLPKGH